MSQPKSSTDRFALFKEATRRLGWRQSSASATNMVNIRQTWTTLEKTKISIHIWTLENTTQHYKYVYCVMYCCRCKTEVNCNNVTFQLKWYFELKPHAYRNKCNYVSGGILQQHPVRTQLIDNTSCSYGLRAMRQSVQLTNRVILRWTIYWILAVSQELWLLWDAHTCNVQRTTCDKRLPSATIHIVPYCNILHNWYPRFMVSLFTCYTAQLHRFVVT